MSSLSFRWVFAAFPLVLSASCAPGIKREEVVQRAYEYTQVEWTPRDSHVRHGKDAAGIMVHTPDRSLIVYGKRGGWWKSGEPAKGVPYKWGGFDTPRSFLAGVRIGKKAGDVGGDEKRELDNAAVSKESVGVDCSGFVSRCWKLDRHYSTRELPGICDKLASWDELKAGDILLKDGHVLIFSRWSEDGSEVVGYEAGSIPAWRTNACGIKKSRLKGWGYEPWRYRRIKDS